VEHHFLEEYSHSPAPEVFLGAAGQRTKNIRLAHGIMQLTTNHPARVAEKIATLDLVSNGRVEMGIGEGASITELGPFDVLVEEKRAIWEDEVRAVLPMFKDGVSGCTTVSISNFRCETCYPSRYKSLTHHCGLLVRSWIRSRWWVGAGWARLAFSS
jgi:alkanesulfonate monooxygenase SsuD/methylene tetrahydromethanopterin reductase-like flavin-dependent oxidoreductase (luciferase family)